MAKKRNKDTADLFNVREKLTTAPCVPAIRNAVEAWRSDGYKGITKTTRELINFWFYNDHKNPDGSQFRYYHSQQEAIETIIYIYEVVKVRNRKQLLEQFAYSGSVDRLPPYDDFARYCVKMATGSGKTKVMSLAMAGQYFNAIREDEI